MTLTMREGPLRVGVFTEVFLPKIDGVGRVLCLQLDHFRRVGLEAVVFASGRRVKEYQGFPVVSAPGIPVPFYPDVELTIPRRGYFQMLRDFKPDIVHVLNPISLGLFGMYYARELNVPLVVSFHAHIMNMAKFYHWGMMEEPLWWLHKTVYRKADCRLAPSLHIVQELEERGFGPVRHWRRGVDVDMFAPCYRSEAVRRDLTDGHPEKVLLLTVSRLAEEKQIEKLIPVLDAIPNVHLAIVGDGPHRAALEKKFAGYPVTFTGFLSGRPLSEAYASSDIFLFYSSPMETFGLVVAEALASGIPAVSSRVGGIPEIIEHGENGYLYEQGDIDELIACTKDLAMDTQKREAMGQAARRKMETLTWPAIMDELIGVYHEVIDEYRHRRNGK